MTAKEKAKELVNRFDESLNHLTSGTNGIEKYIYERAVSCALIAVDEILNFPLIPDAAYAVKKYWEEVKQEIEKL